MGGQKRKWIPHKRKGGMTSAAQRSVADLMEDTNIFTPNEKLDVRHPKIKNPALAKK